MCLDCEIESVWDVVLLRSVLFWFRCLAEDGKCEAESGSMQCILVVANLLLPNL